MPTTSSEISARPSTDSSWGAAGAWLGLAALFALFAFVATSSGEADRNLLFKYSFAVVSLVAYTVLVAVTFLIALAIGRPLAAMGLARFEWRWVWTALGVIVLSLVAGLILEPFLHAGEEQGLEPRAWDPDRAAAFAVNCVVAATVVPFAEELFFRGLGVRVLLPFGGLAAIGVTAVGFGLGHGILVALPVLVLFGAGLAWVRLRSGSVWPGMLAHGMYNGSILLYVYFDLT